MTILSAAVEARYSSTRVRGWTNGDNPDASTVNQTILLQACSDATNDFPTYVGVDYDETDAQHLLMAIRGVRAYLLLYMDQSDGQKYLDTYHDDLERLAKIKGRDRVQPQTTSRLVPTIEGADGRTRPNFDNSTFDDVNLRNPDIGGGSIYPLD